MSRKPSLLATATKTKPPRRARSPQPAGNYVAPSRADKTARTFYLSAAYWEKLEELSFRTRDENRRRTPQERLVAEALNLLFLKHKFPPVREGGKR